MSKRNQPLFGLTLRKRFETQTMQTMPARWNNVAEEIIRASGLKRSNSPDGACHSTCCRGNNSRKRFETLCATCYRSGPIQRCRGNNSRKRFETKHFYILSDSHCKSCRGNNSRKRFETNNQRSPVQRFAKLQRK